MDTIENGSVSANAETPPRQQLQISIQEIRALVAAVFPCLQKKEAPPTAFLKKETKPGTLFIKLGSACATGATTLIMKNSNITAKKA